MTPRVDIRALDGQATASDVALLTRDTGLSQFPVYRDNLDDIIGVVHVKSALAVPVDRRRTAKVVDLITELILVPETLPADRLLDRLRERESLAAVVDEYGGIVGIVTLEDIVEEVVGGISDEHDTDDIDPVAELAGTADGRCRWRADGIIRTDQLAALGVPGTDGPYETLAGLIADRLDRIPVPGDQVTVAGWSFDVETVAHHVAERVRITAPHRSDGDRPDVQPRSLR